MHYVYQNETSVLLQIELAGISPQDVELTLEKDELHIKATRKQPDARLLIGEIESHIIHKTFQLNRELDVDQIKAHMKDGILSLTFAKRSAKRHIEIQAA